MGNSPKVTNGLLVAVLALLGGGGALGNSLHTDVAVIRSQLDNMAAADKATRADYDELDERVRSLELALAAR